jgi:hypothetical protein
LYLNDQICIQTISSEVKWIIQEGRALAIAHQPQQQRAVVSGWTPTRVLPSASNSNIISVLQSSLSDATAFSVGWVIAAVIKTHLIPIAHPHIPRPASHTDAHARGVVVDDSLTPVVLHFPPALDYWPCI